MIFKDRKGNPVEKPADRKTEDRTGAYGIAMKNNQVLVVKPTWLDVWELPGGEVEKDEDQVTALKREFLEETGYEISKIINEPVRSEKCCFYADDLDIFFKSKRLFFKIELGKNNPDLINKEEIKEVKWMNINELKKNNFKDFHLDVLNKINNN